jgi:two-component system, NtrC family, response regulator GlrR
MQSTQRLSDRSELLRVDPKTGALRSREYKLSVVTGPDAGKELMFNQGLMVGTQPDCGFVLTDGAVSRQHVELRARPDGLFVKDLRSTNGTFVSGVRIEEAMLEEESTFRVGKTLLRVSILERDLGVPESDQTSFGEAKGQSRVMRRLFAVLERVSPTDSPVILTGETGTGKEVLAKAIHERSDRRGGPFVVFDCSAVAPSLMESELFGHARGAFTGAVKEKRGLFESSDKGTLFLDEMGELPLELQPKLLRALEAGTFRRVGEEKYRTVDTRIICATHRHLETEVREGRFRQDLFFRLAVAQIRVPPLRERIEDIPLLIRNFLAQQGDADHQLSDDVLGRAMSYSWPGNVRELRNFVSRALLGSGFAPLGGELNPQMPEASSGGSSARMNVSVDVPFKQAKEQLVELFTREYIVELLAKHGGNISQAAKAAGLARTYIHRLVVRYGLKGVDDPAP